MLLDYVRLIPLRQHHMLHQRSVATVLPPAAGSLLGPSGREGAPRLVPFYGLCGFSTGGFGDELVEQAHAHRVQAHGHTRVG